MHVLANSGPASGGDADTVAVGIFEDEEPPAGAPEGDEAGGSQKRLERRIVSGAGDLGETVADAAIVADSVNGARDLQNRAANDLTPSALGEHATAIAEQVGNLSVEVEGRKRIIARGMGAFAAVAQGSDEEPALITMRYAPPGADGPTLAFVGKAVTFDSGGISLKPG